MPAYQVIFICIGFTDEGGVILFYHGWIRFNNIFEEWIVIPKELIDKSLSWVHIVINNAKKLFLNVFHEIKPDYLQNYLHEFCYKFNRRYFGESQFERVLEAPVSYKNPFRYHVR